MNTNGPLLSGLARESGLAVVSAQTVPDDELKLVEALQRALAAADLVALSGGVSAGEYDFVPDAITACGLQFRLSRVALKPGMPTVFATGAHGILFGLPGNPVAVYLTFHLFVLRAVARLTGGSFEPRRFEIRLADDFARRSSARMEYSPCRITADGLAESIPYHGSAHLAALMRADGFIVIPRGVNALCAGTAVPFVMFGAEGP
jgi:molybdopterin molybdotransferase